MDTPKQVYRSTTNRMIAGVAGGIAEYANVDPTIVRLVFLVLGLAGGTGLLAYIIGWIIIPEAKVNHKETPIMADEAKPTPEHATTHEHRDHPASERTSQGRTLAGLILVALGAAFLIQETIGFDVWRFSWPVLLIVIGLFFIVKRR